jgi:hypothetical protein
MNKSAKNAKIQNVLNRRHVQKEAPGEHGGKKKAKRTKTPFFHLSTPGELSFANGQSVRVHCDFVGCALVAPTYSFVSSDIELLKAVRHQKDVKLTIIGCECRVRIIGARSSSTLVVESLPIFRAIAERVANAPIVL